MLYELRAYHPMWGAFGADQERPARFSETEEAHDSFPHALDVPSARAVTVEHARLVTEQGGVVGVFPVSISYHGFAAYIEHIVRMIRAVAVDRCLAPGSRLLS